MTEIIRRAVSGGNGDRSWTQERYVVERPTDDPGVVAFSRYSSRAEAEADAARDGTPVNRRTRRWELLDDDEGPDPRWSIGSWGRDFLQNLLRM